MFSLFDCRVFSGKLRATPPIFLAASTLAVGFGLTSNLGLDVAGASSTLGHKDSSTLYKADQALIKACMSSNGFEYWTQPKPVRPPEVQFPYGIDNLAWAKANGFGAALFSKITPNERYVSGLIQPKQNRYDLDLNGPGPSGPGVAVTLPTGEVLGHSSSGCVAEADRKLFGNYQGWFRISSQYQDLNDVIVGRVLQNRVYDAAVLKWSSCMSSHGDTYASPAQAMQSFLTAKPAKSRALEKTVAESEVICGDQVGLFRIANRLANEIREVVDHQYAIIVHSNNRYDDAALSRASKILGMS
jgi:hypothetical protein